MGVTVVCVCACVFQCLSGWVGLCVCVCVSMCFSVCEGVCLSGWVARRITQGQGQEHTERYDIATIYLNECLDVSMSGFPRALVCESMCVNVCVYVHVCVCVSAWVCVYMGVWVRLK